MTASTFALDYPKAPGCQEEPGSPELWSHTLEATEPQLAVASRQQEGRSSALSSPAPKLSRQPSPLLHAGSRRWPSEQPLPHCPPVQESSQESKGAQPQGPRPLCTPALWPAPVYSVPVYVGLTV